MREGIEQTNNGMGDRFIIDDQGRPVSGKALKTTLELRRKARERLLKLTPAKRPGQN